eukprot:SAG31_NODE_41_length_31342_cov_8.029286_26_plen_91_part_00
MLVNTMARLRPTIAHNPFSRKLAKFQLWCSQHRTKLLHRFGPTGPFPHHHHHLSSLGIGLEGVVHIETGAAAVSPVSRTQLYAEGHLLCY